MPPPRQYQTTGGAVDYVRRVAIQDSAGMQFQRQMDVEDHVIQASPVELHLISDQQYSSDPSDPGQVFGRMGYVGADAVAGMLAGQLITQTTAVPMTVTLDSSGAIPFSVGDVAHISREAFTVSAVDNVNKTVTFDTRSVMGTTAQRHEFSPNTGTRPIVTKPAVYFKGRKAIIYENTINEDGSVDHSKWVERWRGFLATEPEPGELGMIHTIRLRIAPLSAAIDRPLGKTDNRNKLHNSYHAFGTAKVSSNSMDCRLGTELHMLEAVLNGSVYENRGAILNDSRFAYYYRHQIDGTLPEGVPVSSTAGHSQHFDTSLPNGHPRTGPMVPAMLTIAQPGVDDRAALHPTGYNQTYNSTGDPNNPTNHLANRPIEPGIVGNFWDITEEHWNAEEATRLSLVEICVEEDPNTGACVDFENHFHENPNPDGGQPGWRDGYQNANTTEWRVAELWDYTSNAFPQVHPWPARVFSAIETGWSEEDTKAVRGGFVRGRLDMTDPIRPDLVFTLSKPDRPRQASVLLSNEDVEGNTIYQRMGEDVENGQPISGFQWTDKGSAGAVKTTRDARRCVSPVAVLLGEEAEVEEGEEPRSTVNEFPVTHQTPGRVPTRVAQAFYQSGEFFIVVAEQPFIPAGSTLLLRAFVGDEEDEPICTFSVESAQQVVVGLDQVWVCTLKNTKDAGSDEGREIISFATYPGDPDVTLEPAIRFFGESIGSLLLKLLCSSGGNRVTSSNFDVLPFGCGFTDGSTSAADLVGADVDAESFLSIPNPIGQAAISAQLLTGESVADVCVGLLRAVGYTIDIQTDDLGHCRMVAVPLGLPSVTESIAHITESDISEKNVSSPAENAIFNAYEFLTNFDPNGVKDPIARTVVDAVSVNTFGEEKKLTTELRGVVLDLDLDFLSQLRPMFSRMRREFAFPRRLWKFNIRSGLATQMRLGGTYQVTHSMLRGAKGLGVTAALARLRSVKANGWKSTASVEFVAYGEGGAGWGPGADIVSVIPEFDSNGNPVPSTKVAVSSNTHAPFRHPQSGQDLSDSGIGTTLLSSTSRTVYVYAPGNMDGGQLLEIASVDTNANPNQITFTAAHGITEIADEAVHGFIVPDVHEPPAPHKDYGYIGRVLVI